MSLSLHVALASAVQSCRIEQLVDEGQATFSRLSRSLSISQVRSDEKALVGDILCVCVQSSLGTHPLQS